MAAVNMEELLLQAAGSEADEAAGKLLEKFNADGKIAPEYVEKIELALDAWGASIEESEKKAKFCMGLALLDMPDSAKLRNALSSAVKKLLPPYLAKQGLTRAIGIRDTATSIPEIIARFNRLFKIKLGAVVYLPTMKMWGKIQIIDEFAPSAGISSITGTTTSSVPLQTVISTAFLFDHHPDMSILVKPDKRSLFPSSRYRKIFKSAALTEITDEQLREILIPSLTGVDKLSPEKFEEWWVFEEETVSRANAGVRPPYDARSIQELHVLLLACENSGLEISPEGAEKLARFFTNLRTPIQPKDVQLLAEELAMLTAYCKNADQAKLIFAGLKGKAPFWPVNPSSASFDSLVVWGKLTAKHLAGLSQLSTALFPEEYLAALIVKLPLKAVTQLGEEVDDSLILEEVKKLKVCPSDLLLWLWKSRTKRSDEILELMTMGNIMAAISVMDLPKEWTAAQRELKKLLFEKADFQKFLLDLASDDISSIIVGMQKARNFLPGEHQSLLVKLSRSSQELKELLEKGEAKRLLAGGASSNREEKEKKDAAGRSLGPTMTSINSVKRLMKELDDIIKIHLPENTAAVAHARGFGDFRENAEYDAAKERRRFLHRRKAELESLVATIQAIDFKTVTPKDYVIIGSTVKLQLANGSTKDYYIVGAWDGDPDNNCIAYKTKLGEKLIDAKKGDSIELPDGAKAKILDVLPLPDTLVAKLSDDKSA